MVCDWRMKFTDCSHHDSVKLVSSRIIVIIHTYTHTHTNAHTQHTYTTHTNTHTQHTYIHTQHTHTHTAHTHTQHTHTHTYNTQTYTHIHTHVLERCIYTCTCIISSTGSSGLFSYAGTSIGTVHLDTDLSTARKLEDVCSEFEVSI